MDLQKFDGSLSEPLLFQDKITNINKNQQSKTRPTESYHGKASLLSTGMLFGLNPQGIVDSIPHPNKPCLLFSDWCPIGACAHIALLEKDWEVRDTTFGDCSVDDKNESLFTVVHVCQALANHDDGGMRLLKKITSPKGGKEAVGNTPVLVHESNIIIESCSRGSGLLGLLLPGYIDEAVGRKNSLRPDDAVGLYNMNLFIQRHSNLLYLVDELICSQSSIHRLKLSSDLLSLLKTIDSDLHKFEGPYLCGEQFTLADICVYPFLEQIVVVLSHYRNFFIPPSLTHLITWYDTVSQRHAVSLATADRSDISMNTYCYEQKGRKQYLLEVYESQVRGERQLFRELNDDMGQAGVNVYREVIDEERRYKLCEVKTCQKLQKCIIS
ncbi:hypothetical protein HJC23_011659 [Cyclotella cryptica]|uniref:GST C-terminal domain-containing protein n=1 Tax=Cyclotella cryptica TaxID=29204 RepID=A0ABD3NSV1_9STRA|eukprot:CCRYP_020105-RA/>CCRYP_020105-RA protein AED:0.17 eAED:0.17 QI:129/1/1/1/0.5/0.33/3/596/382